MSEKVAVVSGSNKGIGFAIVKGLCKRFDGVVYMTSRNDDRGHAAVTKLNKLGFHPLYHQLDVSDRSSVAKFKHHIQENHGGIDILVNNAGVAGNFLTNTYKASKEIIDINYGGIINVQEFLFPLLRGNARVLNISSDCGHLSNVRDKYWIERLSSKNLSKSDIDEFVNWYLNSIRNGTFKRSYLADNGTVAAYRISKVAISALTIIQQKELESKNISVNSMHPGLVSTDMTMKIGFFTPDQAAETPLYLVLDAPDSLKGAYVWYDGRLLDWYDYNANYYFKGNSVPRQALKKIFQISSNFSRMLVICILMLIISFMLLYSFESI